MATEETKCADNFYLPIGPQGERGEQGPVGPQGTSGAPQSGIQGPSGGSKIDINLQKGTDPYIQADIAENWFTLAHFIYPGSAVFTPQTWRTAIATFANKELNSVFLRLGYINDAGQQIILATHQVIVNPSNTSSTTDLSIEEVSNLGSFPADPTNFFVQAKVGFVGKGYVTNFYATELRG
jgi:hypothetical protein